MILELRLGQCRTVFYIGEHFMAACDGIELVRSIYRGNKAHDKKEPLEEFLDNSKTESETVNQQSRNPDDDQKLSPVYKIIENQFFFALVC